MKYMIERIALANLVVVAGLLDEIRTTVPSDLIRSGFAAESFIDGNDINVFIYFYIHRFECRNTKLEKSLLLNCFIAKLYKR
jgi:hypothetical protein